MGKDIYKDDSIESLDPREHVRLRSGMYIGSNESPNQLLLEVFSNALDEHNIGHGGRINVSISEDGTCSVEDYGQGFPINVMRDDRKTVLEASVSVINTSGKYRDDGVYSGSALGLNGVGMKISNFLSEWFEVISGRDGQYEHLWFKDGIFQKRELGEWDQHSGTIVTYKPDAQFFETDKTDIKYFERFFHDIACLCPDLTICFNNKNIKHNGIDDLVTIYNGNTIELIGNRFNYKSNNCDICFTFTGKSSSEIRAYVNYGYTDSGPHITGIKSTLTRVLNNWARENDLLKEKDKNLDGNAIQEGMLLACNIVSTGVTYNSQTKEKIVKMDTSFLTNFSTQLEVWLDNNPEDAKIIIEKALIARKAAEAAKKAREAVKNKANKKDKVFKLPTTLTDCWTKDRNKAELTICEGKSAASGLVAARNSETQAVYGVRGKMLSVLKTKPENIIKNQEINNLIQALGLEYNPKNAKCVYDKNKLRYGKIIAAADAK